MRRLPNNQMEFNIGLGVKAHSLDVVADIIGTMRMQKIIEITENVQPNEKERIEQLDKELHILTIEEKIVLGLNPYNLNEEDANTIRQSVIDKVIRLYAPFYLYHISPACNNRSQSRKSRASSILRAAVFVPV